MDLQKFTHITLAVLEDQGAAAYAPTIIAGETVQVIQGIPEGMDHRDALQETAVRLGLEQSEFFFGVRSGPGEITTGFHSPAGDTFQRISEMRQGFVVSDLEDLRLVDPGPGAGPVAVFSRRRAELVILVGMILIPVVHPRPSTLSAGGSRTTS